MKRILRLTESELTNLIKRIVKEQKEISPLTGDIRIYKFGISGGKGGAKVKIKGRWENFPSCGKVPICFEYPSSLKDGEYSKDNFSGDLFFTYNTKKYKCKLEQACQPI